MSAAAAASAADDSERQSVAKLLRLLRFFLLHSIPSALGCCRMMSHGTIVSLAVGSLVTDGESVRERKEHRTHIIFHVLSCSCCFMLFSIVRSCCCCCCCCCRCCSVVSCGWVGCNQEVDGPMGADFGPAICKRILWCDGSRRRGLCSWQRAAVARLQVISAVLLLPLLPCTPAELLLSKPYSKPHCRWSVMLTDPRKAGSLFGRRPK